MTDATNPTMGGETVSYTKGPWHSDGFWIFASSVPSSAISRAFATVNTDEREANARLIAAAPDYDAAADQAIAAIEALTGTIPEDQMDALMAAYKSLRSARFKAGCDVRSSERAPPCETG
jgi:hypothetical protein